MSNKLRLIDKDDLNLVLEWRNHPNIRDFMFDNTKIKLEQHLKWFEHVKTSKYFNVYIFEINSIPMGFMSFHNLKMQGIADWGFYTAPDAPKGTGTQLAQTSIHHAFNSLKFSKIYGQVLVHNTDSIRLHERMGFLQEGVLRKQYYDGQSHHDIVCFGLLDSEWKSQYPR